MALAEELFIPLLYMIFGGVILYFLLIPVIYIKDLMASMYLPTYTLFFHLYPVIYLYLPILATLGYGAVLVKISHFEGIGAPLFSSLVGLTLLLRLFLVEYEEIMRSVFTVLFTLPPVLFFFSFLPVIFHGESLSILFNLLTPLLPKSITSVILPVPVAMLLDYYRIRKITGL